MPTIFLLGVPEMAQMLEFVPMAVGPGYDISRDAFRQLYQSF